MNEFTKPLHAFYGKITQPCSAKKYAVCDKAMRTRCRLAIPRPVRVRHGGALKKTIISIFVVMMLASVMFAQRATSRAATSTNATSGSCTSTSSTSAGRSTTSASERTQSPSTAGVLGTRSKVAAALEGIHVVRGSQSPSISTGTAGGVLLPRTVVPFR